MQEKINNIRNWNFLFIYQTLLTRTRKMFKFHFVRIARVLKLYVIRFEKKRLQNCNIKLKIKQKKGLFYYD